MTTPPSEPQEVPAQEVHGINIFGIAPENQQELLDCMRGMGKLEDIPGLLSLQVLRSITDNRKMMNYMRWESVAAFEQAEQHPAVANVIEVATRLVEPGNPDFWQVVHTQQ